MKIIIEVEDCEDCPGACDGIKEDADRFKASTIELLNDEIPELCIIDITITD